MRWRGWVATDGFAEAPLDPRLRSVFGYYIDKLYADTIAVQSDGDVELVGATCARDVGVRSAAMQGV